MENFPMYVINYRVEDDLSKTIIYFLLKLRNELIKGMFMFESLNGFHLAKCENI